MKVAIVGATGTMGRGIVKAFAQANWDVALCGRTQAKAESAKEKIESSYARLVQKGKLTQQEVDTYLGTIVTGTINQLCQDADLVVETVAEDITVKKEIFALLDDICKDECLFTSNTSSLSIQDIEKDINRPIVGMHFFNPADRMKLIEVVRTKNASDSMVNQVVSISEQLGNTPVVVRQSPGFIVNRILIPMINEAASILAEDVASAKDIDTAMKLGANHPMGPLELGDLIGLDVVLSIMNNLHEGTGDAKYRPCSLITNLVKDGNLGVKTGKGFYEYKRS